jgi:hypothetical protein
MCVAMKDILSFCEFHFRREEGQTSGRRGSPMFFVEEFNEIFLIV